MIRIVLSLFYFILVSCGQQGQSNLKVSIGAVTGSAQFPGGLVIMGQNKTTGQFFSKKVSNSDTFEFEVDNGNWNFVTMGWDSSSFIFEGTPYCDVKENIKIEGDDFFLKLVASNAKCSSSVFGKHTTNNFNNLIINTCMGIDKKIATSNLTDPSLICDGSQDFIVGGGRGSVRLTMLNFDNQKGIDQSQALVSKCYDFSGSQISSNIKLPFWNNETPFPLKVEAFNDSGCSSANGSKVILMQNGLAAKSPANQAQALHDSSSLTSLFLNTNKCTPSQLANSPFGNGSPSSNVSRLVCNAAQWSNIDSDLGGNGNVGYILGEDIDFVGSNTTISNPMNDYIIGRGFTISNGNNPLFDVIDNSGGQELVISDFKIDNFNINLGSAIPSDVGVLAGNVNTSGNSLSYIEISNIEVTNSLITATPTIGWSSEYVGGLIGYVNSNTTITTDEYIHIKNNKSFTDIDINSSANPAGAVGGLIGYAHGPTTIIQNGIEIVGNKVGINTIKDDPNTNRVELKSLNTVGDTRLGGILGKAKYLTEFRLNLSSTDLDGRSKIGGLIGNIFDNVKIENNFSDTIFNSTNSNPSRIGGVVGNVSGGSADRYILNGYSRLYINDNDTGSKVGGIVGEAISLTNSDDLQIKGYKSVINTDMDGDKFGGVFGEFLSSAGPVGKATIQDVVVEGSIKDSSTAASSEDRGGIAGMSKFLSVKRVIVDILIEGDNHIAGLSGDSTEDQMSEVYANVDLTAYGSSAVYLGGVVGKMNVSSTSLYSNIKVDGSISSVDAAIDCSNPADYCGKLVGQSASAVAPNWSNIIVSALLTDSVGIDSAVCNGSCSGAEIAEFFTSDSTCSSLSPSFNQIGGTCELLTEQFWRESGYGFSELEQKTTYLAGNAIEPFLINDINQWNLIGTKEVLLSKTFKLNKDLDFSYSSPMPIGSSTFAFTGNIIPNNFELRNINMNSNASPYGLFSSISENARIGLRKDPLEINDIYINCTNLDCGIVGRLNNSAVSIQVSKGNINASSSSYIGLVGHAIGDTFISHSSFEGQITGTNVDYIGGLVGFSSSATDLYISKSFVKLSKIVGEDYVGGLIGFKSDSGGEEISIKDSYVWFDKDNQNVGDDIDITSSDAGGISGGFSNGGGNYTIERIYVDFDNASLSGNALSQFQNLIFGTTGTFGIGSSAGYVGSGFNPGAESGHQSASNQVNLASLLMFETEQSSSPWYETQDGRVILKWEVGLDRNTEDD